MLSAHCSKVGSASGVTGSDAPVPGWSKKMSRPSDVIASTHPWMDGSSGKTSQFVNQFGTNTMSRGPSARRAIGDAQVPVQRIARLREHCGSVSRGAGRVSANAFSVSAGRLGCRRISSRHGSHLAVGVGSVRRRGTRGRWSVSRSPSVSLLAFVLRRFDVVAFEGPSRYVEAAAVTVVACWCWRIRGTSSRRGRIRQVEQWAAGHEVDRATALDATYAWTRGARLRVVGGDAVWAAIASGRCRCDRRGDWVAAGPVRDPGRRLRGWPSGCSLCTASWKRSATGQGRHRR